MRALKTVTFMRSKGLATSLFVLLAYTKYSKIQLRPTQGKYKTFQEKIAANPREIE